MKDKRRDSRSRSRGRRRRSRSPSPDHPSKPSSSQPELNVKKHRKAKVQEVLGYTNNDNPFNDPCLTEKFVWKKRSEFLHAAGLYDKSDKKAQMAKIDATMVEVERVKMRRDERVVEQQLLEEQRAQRERELQQETYDDWESKEEIFHLEQIKTKSAIRIEQGRERPVDLMYKAMQIIDGAKFDDMELMSTPPYRYIQDMYKDDLVELRKDVRDFASAEEAHRDDWEAIGVLCDDALQTKDAGGSAAVEESGIPANIYDDVHDMLSGMRVDELETAREEVADSLNSQHGAVDTTFMEAVRKRIPFYIATRKVINMHEKATKMVYGSAVVPKKRPLQPVQEDTHMAVVPTAAEEGLSVSEPDEEILLQWEPPLRTLSAVGDVVVLEAASDENARKRIRQELIDLYGCEQDAGYALWKRERNRGFGEDEANFNAVEGQVILEPRRHDWDTKYKPRKPRFFNRVKTGYSWNKYNKAHFDYENPPPKHVCGYRFNIFYPDLIDRIKGAPKYKIEKSDAPDTVIMRFSAGPPYEDIAFKIVNREWMLNPRQGFRCVFDKGVLQLYFNVKRGWYKR